ncbi:hypothetical protein ILYODFUR_019305 [Ilyodon furcidens]|uniref:Uncharacterized protein n=1 Tax=Ilyodon furcidens TaxID=33524 RepID=A0ABV0TLF0_9TELE
MKVACPPPTVQQNKKVGDMTNELVRHFLIETSPKGVRLKGCPNEPYFGCLSALVYQHAMTPLALPCKLMIPTKDPNEEALELATPTDPVVELLKQGAGKDLWALRVYISVYYPYKAIWLFDVFSAVVFMHFGLVQYHSPLIFSTSHCVRRLSGKSNYLMC